MLYSCCAHLGALCWCYVAYSNIGGPSAEKEIAAQKEQRKREGCSCSVCGRLGSKSIVIKEGGEIPESVYQQQETFRHLRMTFPIAALDYSSFLVLEALYLTADADGKITITLAGNAGSYTATVDSLRPDDHWRLWRFKAVLASN